MQISIVGASLNAPLWRAMVSQKVSNRDKFLRDLDKNIDKITASALKKFPQPQRAANSQCGPTPLAEIPNFDIKGRIAHPGTQP
jgi:hypothetical protein